MPKPKLKDLPPHRAIGHVMFEALKPFYAEGKQRIKDELKAEREAQRAEREEASKQMETKAACFEVIPDAVAHVSGNNTLPYNARRLFYAVRDRIQALNAKPFNPKTGYDYFRDTILQDYQKEHGKLEGLYYDPRGRLHEPHNGRSVDMGTREVEAYSFPHHVFNKLLYVEKKGQYPLIQSARLTERYDMAVMTGEGFATEAARTLLERADKHERIQLFVLHDADPSGYEIARTVREETARMPGYSVEVIDMGLTVAQGIEMGMEPEKFDRESGLKKPLVDALISNHNDPEALDYFMGTERRVVKKGKLKTIWVDCKRFELDTMTAPEAIALIERGLQAEGVYGKVIPPDEELPKLAESIYRSQHATWVDAALTEMLGLGTIKKALADEFMEHFKLENSERYIGARFKKDDALSWRDAFKDVLSDIQDAKHTDALKAALKEKVTEALNGKEN